MKKLNKKGSLLVSVIGIVLLVFVILGVVLTMAYSYQQRSINEHARKQAYLNGVSACDMLAGAMAKGTESSLYIPTSDKNIINITDISLPSVGGTLSATIELSKTNSSLVYIKVISTYNKQTEKVQLTMQKSNSKWYKKVYSQIGDDFIVETE